MMQFATMDNGQCSPLEFVQGFERKPYLPSGAGPDESVKMSLGTGEWPVGLLKEDAYDFWQNVKSMFYRYTVTIEVVSNMVDAFASGIAVSDMASLTTTGVTRRFWNFPNRSPGYHATYRGKNGIINGNATADFRIDMSKAVYGLKSRRPVGPFWFPQIKIAAVMQSGGHSMTLNSGGTDGFLDIGAPSGAGWAMPVFPMIGLSATLTSTGSQVGDPIIDAAVKVMERYDMITFSPRKGPAGTVVTIVQPPVSDTYADAKIREGFRNVKEVWLGDRKITTFNPLTDIQGQYKEIIKVTIPAGFGSDRFNFIAKYDNLVGKDDYYYTPDNFRVTA